MLGEKKLVGVMKKIGWSGEKMVGVVKKIGWIGEKIGGISTV